MNKLYRIGPAAIAVAAALTLSACSGSQTDTTATSAATETTTTVTSATAEAAAHNDADVAFAQGMIPHHQQAIEMSDMLIGKQGIDPEVIKLANAIKAAQGPEITTMQGWLSEWGVSATPAPTTGMSGMPGHDMGDGTTMPGTSMPGTSMPGMDAGGGHGMMSAEDMTALQNAEGAEASRLFLTQMIQHHEGAITMAQTEIKDGKFPAAIEMAKSVVSTQQQEIDTMKSLQRS